MNLFVVGVNFRSAPVALREQLAIPASRLQATATSVKVGGNLAELALLGTCNRVEIYGTGVIRNRNLSDLFTPLSPKAEGLSQYLYVHEGAEAVRHLFSVASGLDSMVLGETEITGQVKQAYLAAQQVKLTGPILNRLFQTALQVAKEVRSNTQIGCGAVSVGSVAVDLAEKIFDQDLRNRTVLIIGAGKMAEACLRHFTKQSRPTILVCNRSFERAETLATEFGGRAVRFEDLFTAMIQADIVVSSTGADHAIVRLEQVEKILPERRSRPLFLVDIAVPRDIDAAVEGLNNVYLYNIDDLECLMKENLRLRQQELALCRAIIDRKTEALMAKLAPGLRGFSPSTLSPDSAWVSGAPVSCTS